MAQSELALEEYKAGSCPVEELKRIKDGAIRGSEIVRQLMIYAGKESDAVGLADVSQVARGMVELLKVSISKHAALVTDFGEDLPAVRGSTGEIQQIVMNLVTNASEALEDRDGVIRVTTRRVNVDRAEAVSKGIAEGDYVELEVADTGRGMSFGDAGPDIRSVLHHQVPGPRSGDGRGPWNCAGSGWSHPPCEPVGQGYNVSDIPALHRNCNRGERATPLCRRIKSAAAGHHSGSGR
jgi:hypothetical protein